VGTNRKFDANVDFWIYEQKIPLFYSSILSAFVQKMLHQTCVTMHQIATVFQNISRE